MAELVYLLCALLSTACAVLLVRQYARVRTKLLLWSSVCFAGLAVNNALLFVDLVLVPAMDLSMPRTAIALVSMSALVYGLVWEVQ